MRKSLLLLLLPFWGVITSFKPDAIVYSVPEEFTPNFVDYQVDPSIHTQLHIGDKGTVLHIPENAFVDLEGNVVEEPVTIQFKEYTNAAEIAFSQIPMTYKGNHFNSSGMFEIQGQANGEPIRIATGKSLTIDYRLAKKNPDTDFYRLNERSNQWELVSKIPQMSSALLTNKNIAAEDMNRVPEVIEMPVKEQAIRNPIMNSEYIYNDNRNLNQRNLNQINFTRDTVPLTVNKWKGLSAKKEKNNRVNSNQPKGAQVYADIVNDLRIGGFGVYNCDQIYRLSNPVTLTAKYQDEAGNSIADLYTLSLLNLNYNNAFTFRPENFTCDAKGDNVLLLFAQNGDLYLLDKGEFGKMKISGNGEQTFTLKNVSSFIKNTADLAKHLGIS